MRHHATKAGRGDAWQGVTRRRRRDPCGAGGLIDHGYMSRQIRKFRMDIFDGVTNRNFDSCNSCKRLETSRLHELHETKLLPFVSLSNLSARNSRIFLLAYPGSFMTMQPMRQESGCLDSLLSVSRSALDTSDSREATGDGVSDDDSDGGDSGDAAAALPGRYRRLYRDVTGGTGPTRPVPATRRRPAPPPPVRLTLTSCGSTRDVAPIFARPRSVPCRDRTSGHPPWMHKRGRKFPRELQGCRPMKRKARHAVRPDEKPVQCQGDRVVRASPAVRSDHVT